eukprot:ctg_2307.g567
MGAHYAERQGQAQGVARAIYEAALPRAAGGALPETVPGAAIAVADRLDSLVGLFAVGMAPRSVADPFALRRAALGVVQILVAGGYEAVDLARVVPLAAQQLPVPADAEVCRAVLEFVERRLEQWLIDGEGAVQMAAAAAEKEGVEAMDTGGNTSTHAAHVQMVRAVLRTHATAPARAYRILETLRRARDSGRLAEAITAFERPYRLVSAQGREFGAVQRALLCERAERELYEAMQARGLLAPRQRACDDVDGVLADLIAIKPSVDGFMDHVLVLVDDEALRRNRLALCEHISRVPRGVLDLSEIQQ